MAFRPVYVSDDVTYVKTVNVAFEYHNGLSKSQRQRSSESLHDAFNRDYPDAKVLEVSSFSQNTLGNELSAFNLPISLLDGKKVPLEVAFQAGKVFEQGGPYKDLLSVSPKIAKSDPRLSESGRIISFDFEGRSFSAEPVTLFYTWIFMKALTENSELANQLCEYNSFTDIVFNPKKSINCQAFACAIYVSLQKKMQVERALEDIDFLSDILRKISPYPTTSVKPCSFKKFDVIMHPKYGEGIIKKLKESETGYKSLIVAFPKLGTEKELSESWVREKCDYDIDYHSLYERIDLTEDGIHMDKFDYYQNKLNPFTAQMKITIRLAEQCLDNQVSFAVLADTVIAVLLPGESIAPGRLLRNISKKCQAILGSHPDFETVAIEDKMFFVLMRGNIISIVPNESKAQSLDFMEALVHRQEILDACKKMTIYGFAVGKNFKHKS